MYPHILIAIVLGLTILFTLVIGKVELLFFTIRRDETPGLFWFLVFLYFLLLVVSFFLKL